jgi:hypothetical protein
MRKFLFVSRRDAKGKPVQFEDYSKIAKQFETKVLDKLSERTSHPLILEHMPHIERAQLSKLGPKSQFVPYYESKLHERVDEVMEDSNSILVEDAALNATIDYLRSFIERGSVPLVSIDQVWNTLPDEKDMGDINAPSLDFTTNSGPPFYMRQWRDITGQDATRNRVSDAILRTAKYYNRYLQDGVPVPWRSIMAHRLTSGGHENFATKERPVIAMEKANAVCGKRVTYKLLDAGRKVAIGAEGLTTRPFVAWLDAPHLDIEMKMLLEYQRQNKDIVINSSDVSAFDSSANSNLIMLAGEIVGYWMKGGQKYVRALAESMACHTSVLAPGGLHLPARGGIKSGDGLTNLIDTIMSLIVFWYGHFAGAYQLLGAYAQGDDGIQVGRGITKDNISDVYEVFGFDANPDKQWEAPGTVQYLQKLFVYDWEGGIFPVSRALVSSLTYERLKFKPDEWSPEAQTVQIMSVLENAVFNPLHKDLIDFVAEGDKFHLHSSLSPASKVLQRAGLAGMKVLINAKSESINDTVANESRNGFDLAISNGVLRGETFPPQGGREYWTRAYRSRADGLA